MDIHGLIVPLGIAAYLFLIGTALGGAMKVNLKWHKIGAAVALVLATAHALLALFY